jgi:bifunctional non-homologous end joining protein LigD
VATKRPSRAKIELPRLPRDRPDLLLDLGEQVVRLTNLQKPFWPDLGITKGDLIQYYVDVSPWLLPHIRERAMVMKRYPNGASGDFFFMKRAPTPRPEWIRTCRIEHESAGAIDFPVVDDLATLMWIINLGCIDLNQWYARCDHTDRPDYLHFDLDPGTAPWSRVVECAHHVHELLTTLKMPTFVKTSGSKGLHLYVPIVRGPTQHQVWLVAKAIAEELEARHPKLMTAIYAVRARPPGRVLVDFNQNQWGRTLASIYSVRPHPRACVSTPVTWNELEKGVTIEDFRIDNVPARLRRRGDLWEPVLHQHTKGRFDLGRHVK